MENSTIADPAVKTNLESLVAAAIKAPSGDNMQPWRFELDADKQIISVILDPTRDPSPMNAGQSMSRVACGAALENLIRTASKKGWSTEVEKGNDRCLARILISFNQSASRSASPEEALVERASNRRFYDQQPVPPEIQSALKAAVDPLGKAQAIWSFDAEQKKAIAKLDSAATALMYIQPCMRGAIADNIQFDAPAQEVVTEGLSLGSLELSGVEQVGMKIMFRSPNWLLKYGGGLLALKGHVKRLHTSASGHCLIVSSDYSDAADLDIGRTMQRAWLALTQNGLAAQPMMSVMVLDGVRQHGSAELVETIGQRKIETFVNEFRSILPAMGDKRPAFLLRFGYAAAPSGRTGRLPLSQVLNHV